MRFVTFTDYDTMDAYGLIGWDREDLVPGVEIKIKDPQVRHTIHVNVYLLNRRHFHELERIAQDEACVESFLSYLRSNDLPHVYNHPFWFEPHEEPNYSAIPWLIEQFPVVEYNMHRVQQRNALAMVLAEKFGKGVVATTDTHMGDVGKAYTLAQGTTFRDFFNNIQQRKAYLVPQDLTLDVLSNEMTRWVELIFDPRLAKPHKGISTGIDKLDQGIRAVMEGALKNRPYLKVFCESFGYALSRARFPAWFYLQSQNSKAHQIHRQLRAAGVV